jgi:hypothetical protein
MMIWRLVQITAALVILLAFAACGGADPTATPVPPVKQVEKVSQTPKFDALVAEAKNAPNKEIIGWFEHLNEDLLRKWEDEWEKDFGFRITITSTPGHYSSKSSVALLVGHKAGTAVGDFAQHGAYSTYKGLDDGVYQKINWEPLEEGYPIIKRFRADIPDVALLNDRGKMSDYCMMSEHVGYVWVYNTKNVTADEVATLKIEDLADAKWADRVALSDGGGPFVHMLVTGEHPGWTKERYETMVQSLIANGALVVGGGTAGVLGLVIAGEADIAVGYVNWALNRVQEGAPIAVAPLAGDKVIPMHAMAACVPSLTMNGNEALTQLFLGWRGVRGTAIQDDFFGTGSVMYAEFANPVTKLNDAAGIRFPEDAAYYGTRTQLENHLAYSKELKKKLLEWAAK